MSILRFNLLRNNIRKNCPVGFLKHYAGLSHGKLIDSRRYENRQFTTRVQTPRTKFTEAASWHKTDSGSCIPEILPPWLQQTSEHDQPATVLVFDVETTGFFRPNNRIIELALRDLSGGKNCTFDTLINPEMKVPKFATDVNRISTDLVCRPDIPRFSDILPILLAYVRSRQAPGKPVLWVAHNAKRFDVPFLIQEFDRCSAQIPADWLFVDSLSLARKAMKLEGDKRYMNLEALGEHYGICSKGPSHRAMQDVITLCQILQKITSDLKMTIDGLMNEAMKFSDVRKAS